MNVLQHAPRRRPRYDGNEARSLVPSMIGFLCISTLSTVVAISVQDHAGADQTFQQQKQPPQSNDLLSDAPPLLQWDRSCGAWGTCAPVTEATDIGKKAVRIDAPADEWTDTTLRWRVEIGKEPDDCVLVLSARLRLLGVMEKAKPAAQVRLALEADGGVSSARCEVHDDPPGEHPMDLRVSCGRRALLQGGSTSRASVVFGLAAVRSAASVALESLSLRCAANTEVATASTSPAPPPSIPPLLHFIFGLSPDFGGKPFGLVHHLVIKSALHFASPATARFYYAHEPSGKWWAQTLPLLSPRLVMAPPAVFGRPLRRFAHKADVIRLELLLQFGGVYLDLDVMLLAPITPLMQSHELVLAHEGIDGSIGLGNALMLTRPNSTFMRRWYGAYTNFSDHVWNGFSVRFPLKLALEMPAAVHVLDYGAFYWPPWNAWGVAQLYRSSRCLLRGATAVHLWETKVWRTLLSELTPEDLHAQTSCFANMARAVLSGSYDFETATLRPGELAEENVAVLHSTSLLTHLLGAPTPRGPVVNLAACENLSGNDCVAWAKAGECEKNPQFMQVSCRRACSLCND